MLRACDTIPRSLVREWDRYDPGVFVVMELLEIGRHAVDD